LSRFDPIVINFGPFRFYFGLLLNYEISSLLFDLSNQILLLGFINPLKLGLAKFKLLGKDLFELAELLV
jgi:hypothetical protein